MRMKTIVSVLFAFLFMTCFSFSMPIEAYAADLGDLDIISSDDGMAYILDDGAYFTHTERKLLMSQMQDYNKRTGLNIVIYACDDVGSDKSDYGVVDFADLTYEKYCGMNTDGILLLINNDTKYDYISTSGAGINYYSDYRIECILDNIYDYLVDKDFYMAASEFVSSCEYYFNQGKANHQIGVFNLEFEPEFFVETIFAHIFFALIVGLIVYLVNARAYKLQKVDGCVYISKNTLCFRRSTDTFLRTVTHRIYSPRSSGGSRSGSSHSSRSSTHRSSSGGRHGGGGRHR